MQEDQQLHTTRLMMGFHILGQRQGSITQPEGPLALIWVPIETNNVPASPLGQISY